MVAPKPQSLCAAVAGHYQALEASLRAEYGVELGDLWLDRLSWRKLAGYVQWLRPDAPLYRSMRVARPDGDLQSRDYRAPILTDPLEAIRGSTAAYTNELLLQVLNRIEANDWLRSDKEQRGEFKPTLPPGYQLPEDVIDDSEAMAAYYAGMNPSAAD